MTSILTFSCMKKVNLIFPFSYLKDPNPGSGSGIKDGRIWIRDTKKWSDPDPGSGVNIPDPQYCFKDTRTPVAEKTMYVNLENKK
jgi:hypothetical protein